MFNLSLDQSTLCKCSIHINVVLTFQFKSWIYIYHCHVLIKRRWKSIYQTVLISADFWTQKILTMLLCHICMSVILPDIWLLSNFYVLWPSVAHFWIIVSSFILNLRGWGEVKKNVIPFDIMFRQHRSWCPLVHITCEEKLNLMFCSSLLRIEVICNLLIVRIGA